MDEYVTWKAHEEFCKRMESENARLEDEDTRQNRRIDALEKNFQQLNDLTVSVREMAVNMTNMLEEQKRQGKRLESLEGRDGDMWRTVATHAVTAVVGAVICYMLTRIGLSG